MMHQLHETFPGHNTCKHFEGPRAYGDVVICEASEHYLSVVAHTARVALREGSVVRCDGVQGCEEGVRWIALEKYSVV